MLHNWSYLSILCKSHTKYWWGRNQFLLYSVFIFWHFVYFAFLTCIQTTKTINLIANCFDFQQERLAEQVYAIPWYYLDLQQRKTVYIFMCQTQNKVHYYGFKVYAMNVPIALSVLRMTYSFFNLFLAVLNK